MFRRTGTNACSARPGWCVVRNAAIAVCAALLLAHCGPSGAAGEPASESATTPQQHAPITGFTAPFRSVTIAAVQTGRITGLPAEEGELVELGSDLVQLDDAVQRRRVEMARALAESSLEIEIAQLRLDQAERELDRVEGLQQSSAASEKECIDARSEADVARVLLSQARFEHEQAQRECALQQALLDELRLRAPFTGYVADRLKEVGDTVEEREGVLTLVQLDPLLVVLDCPLGLVARVRVGQQVLVRPPGDDQQPRLGEVVFVNRVAEPASQTFKVKIRVSNADADWVAGRRVSVDFNQAPPVAAAVDGQPSATPRKEERTAGKHEGK